MSDEPGPRPHYYRLPSAFIRDCVECDVDVGFYDWEPKLLCDPTHEQLHNLRDRAQSYVGRDAPDQCPPGLKVAAHALLRRMDALGL